MRLEKLRIAQEKLKRNEAKIEEIYTLLAQISKWVHDVDNDMMEALSEKDPHYDLKATRYSEIKPTEDWVSTLVRLYIRSVRKEIDTFLYDFMQLRDEYIWLFVTSTRANMDEQEAHIKLVKATADFGKSYYALLVALENLVE